MNENQRIVIIIALFFVALTALNASLLIPRFENQLDELQIEKEIEQLTESQNSASDDLLLSTESAKFDNMSKKLKTAIFLNYLFAVLFVVCIFFVVVLRDKREPGGDEDEWEQEDWEEDDWEEDDK